MNFSLQKPRNRALFGIAILGLAAALAGSAGNSWLASFYGAMNDPPSLRWAIALEPHNAQHPHRLGRVLQNNLLEGTVEEAIEHYRQATRLNPRSSGYWMDLASAYEEAGNPTEARQAFAKAKANYPLSAAVAWSHGNFLLRQGELSLGFSEIRRAIVVDPGLTQPAVSVCWRFGAGAERILEEVMPPESRYYLVALRYFVSQREVGAALSAWEKMLTLHQPLDLPQAFPLVERLIQASRMDEAEEVWQQASRAAGRLPDVAESTLVWNGGFEFNLLKGGFGWRHRQHDGYGYGFDTSTYRAGARSLRIRFAGTANVDFQHLFQYVPVEPRTRYRFSAALRTEAISTDSGIRFRIFDPKHRAALDTLTASLVGSQPWTLQQTEFTTGPETRLLVISLRRLPSRKFDNKLRGTVWVDDVSLAPVLTFGGREAK